MKQKIFESLKQAYKSLGLNDASLMLHAELLAGLGTVSDENLAEIVSKQESYLKGLQSENDKRVSSAIETARRKLEDEHAAAKAKAEEEAAKRAAEKQEKAEREVKERAERDRISKLDGIERQLAEYKLEQQRLREEDAQRWEKRIAELLSNNKTTEDALAETRRQLEEKSKAEKAAARSSMINTKAKELGISEARIKEGFAIADDLDDDAVCSYLATVASNQKVAGLPAGPQRSIIPAGQPDKKEIADIASKMLGV